MPLITSKSAQEIRAESLRKPSKRESPTIGIPEAQEAEVTVVPAPPMPAPEIWAEFEAVVQDLPADDHEPAVNDDHDISYDTTQKAGHAEEELYHTHTLNDDNVNTHGRWTEHLGLSSFPDDPQIRMTLVDLVYDARLRDVLHIIAECDLEPSVAERARRHMQSLSYTS